MRVCVEEKLAAEERLWAAVARRELVLPPPPRAVLATSERCGLGCRYCTHFERRYLRREDPLTAPAMDERLLRRVAEQLFPALQCCETTPLGEPLGSPHLDLELTLAAEHGVFARLTTSAADLSDAMQDRLAGRMDFLVCSLDSHERGVHEFLRGGSSFDRTVANLRRFARRRETMEPVPYFRAAAVLTDLNVDSLADTVSWLHEELGVDDVEIVALIVDGGHAESLSVFREPDRVARALADAVDRAVARKYKIRLPFARMAPDAAAPTGADRETFTEAGESGFVPPPRFEKMSYIVRNPRNRWEIGEAGRVWTPGSRGACPCVEFFSRPAIMANGNVEGCVNRNTFLMGNLKRRDFMSIWNGRLYRAARGRLYAAAPLESGLGPCGGCLRAGATYGPETADFGRRPAYRVTRLGAGGERRIPANDTRSETPWPGEETLGYWMRRMARPVVCRLPRPVRSLARRAYRRAASAGARLTGRGRRAAEGHTPC